MIECRPRSFERRLIRSRSGRPLFGRSAPFRTAISRAAELPPAANTSEQSYCLLDARPKLLSGLRDSRERAHHRHRVNSAPVAMINRYLDWYPATREFASGASNQKPIRARDASLGRPADCHASYPPPSDGKRHRRSVSLAPSLSASSFAKRSNRDSLARCRARERHERRYEQFERGERSQSLMR